MNMKERRQKLQEILIELKTLADCVKSDWPQMDTISRCESLSRFRDRHLLSERVVAGLFQISKSEAHRMIVVANLSPEIKATTYKFGTDYHALYVYGEAAEGVKKEALLERLLSGIIRRHRSAKLFLGLPVPKEKSQKARVIVNGRGSVFRCEGCGKELVISYPVEVKSYIKTIQKWKKPHEECRPKERKGMIQ